MPHFYVTLIANLAEKFDLREYQESVLVSYGKRSPIASSLITSRSFTNNFFTTTIALQRQIPLIAAHRAMTKSITLSRTQEHFQKCIILLNDVTIDYPTYTMRACDELLVST